jgi:glycosyltransferase involved in cell wall biosynthesis
VIGVDYPEDSIAYDPLSRDAFNNGIGVCRIPPGFLYKIFYRRKQGKTASKDSKRKAWDIKYKINQLIRSTILIPESYRYWVTPAFKKAAELMERKEYDIIFTAHETPSSHMVGLKLKKSFPKVKWIGYWSDPWNGEKAFREYSLRFKRSIEEKMEQKVVKNVDRLFFTTEGTRLMYIDKYKLDAGRTDVIFRGYDRAKFENIKRKQNPPEGIKCDKINIVYTGTIYGELRSIRPLCSALEYLKYNRKDIFAILNIIFIGQFTLKG